MKGPLSLLLALLPALVLAEPPPAPGAPPLRTLRVGGEGLVSVPPDVAVVSAGVESTGRDLAQVTADASAQLKRVLAALEQAGVAARDVQTTRHDVNVERPWKDGKPGPITGYTVSDEVRVTVRDLSRLGTVLERVVAAGSNVLRGLAFERDDTGPQRARALALAYADARAKAEAIAKAAGVVLGEVLSVSEQVQGARPVPVRMARAALAAEPVPVSPGELQVSGAVEVTFQLR
ncbi:MAG TPA: SIMPL domain-containing protein [Anaeromyxobacter sp.]|nr:SIMPL domain-containing protein [Anaeromyxobacter sp.]